VVVAIPTMLIRRLVRGARSRTGRGRPSQVLAATNEADARLG
jgi:hypothetical protein